MTEQLGARLREARLARGLSLRATAESASISPSLLSQVETGKVQPSVSTLYAVVGALGITVDDVLGSGSSSGRADAPRRRTGSSPVQRGVDAHQIVMENGVTWRQLASRGGREDVDVLLVTYEPGAASSVDGTHMRHLGYEYGYLTRGELTLKLDFESYIVRVGDSLCFDASRPHLYVNHTNAITEGVWFVLGAAGSENPDAGEAGSVRNAVDVLDALGRLHDAETD